SVPPRRGLSGRASDDQRPHVAPVHRDGVHGARGLSAPRLFPVGTSWEKVFEPLKNLEQFTRFQINEDLQTLAWPTGADLADESYTKRALEPGAGRFT